MRDAARGTIVVADDDVATRMLLSQVLARASFHVIAVENGELACQAVHQWYPDAVLLDWAMPVLDGPHAAEILKADPATSAIPILMLTTHSSSEDRTFALDAGVQDYLTKPFNANDLITRLERVIGRCKTPQPLPAHSAATALVCTGVVSGPIQTV